MSCKPRRQQPIFIPRRAVSLCPAIAIGLLLLRPAHQASPRQGKSWQFDCDETLGGRNTTWRREATAEDGRRARRILTRAARRGGIRSCLGHTDHQVKLKGYQRRLSLVDIEAPFFASPLPEDRTFSPSPLLLIKTPMKSVPKPLQTLSERGTQDPFPKNNYIILRSSGTSCTIASVPLTVTGQQSYSCV